MERFLWTVGIFLICIETAWSLCPHKQSHLTRWSALFPELVDKDDNVRIPGNTHVLLDESEVTVRSITIEEEGSLVFEDMAMKLKTKYILIHGSMLMGSEDCKLSSKINITLYGNKDEYNIDGFGEKFIGVDEGGTLEIHGQEKKSWTKLVKTIKGLKTGTHADQKDFPPEEEGGAGLMLFDIDPITDQIVRTVSLTSRTLSVEEAKEAPKKITDIIDAIKDDHYVGIAVKRRVNINSRWEKIFETLENFGYGEITRELKLRQHVAFSAWAMLVDKADMGRTKTQEKIDIDDDDDLVHLVDVYFENNGKRYNVRSWVHTIKRNICYVRARIVDVDVFDQLIEVASDVNSWSPGDMVVFLSTDLDWRQAEIRYVTSCEQCADNEFKIDRELEFTHYGEIYKNVDMRGEVALLNRNIVIEGEDAENSKTFGGHVKFLKGFKDVHIEYAEFHNMGQQESLGNYPLHFHMCEDVDTYSDPPYLRGNSIHDSNARCITIHGTHGLTVQNNFCYISLGHGYFLEDGGEKRTIMEGNLGAGQIKGKLIRSDGTPTTFWITNPQTYFRNNVAAGSDHTGIWFLYPNKPLGPSLEKSFMAEFEAQHTAIYEFNNNVAHSNKRNGLFIDNIMQEDGRTSGSNDYVAWNNPLDSESGYKTVILDRITGNFILPYKNMLQNAWISGGIFHIRDSSFSDSILGVVLRGQDDLEAFMSNTVVIGESPNVGDPSVIPKGGSVKVYPRSVPVEFEETPRQGFVFGWCPAYIDNTWFGGFPITDDYKTGALGFYREKTLTPVLYGGAKEIYFGFEDTTEGNRLFDGDSSDVGYSSEDVDNATTFTDFDGTVTSMINGQIVKPSKVLTTEACIEHSSWKLAVCPHRYAQVLASWKGNAEKMLVKRADADDYLYVDERNGAPFLAIAGGYHIYAVRFDGETPAKINFTFSGLSLSDSVLIAVCVPSDVSVTLHVRSTITQDTTKGTQVSTLDEFWRSTSMLDYFVNTAAGIVYIKGIGIRERTEKDTKACMEEYCPSFMVKVNGGGVSDPNCFDNVARPTKTASFEAKLKSISDGLAAVRLDPPANFGAGDTLKP